MTLFSSPRLRLFIGAALISLSAVWVKLVDVSPTTSGFYRVLIGSAALVIFLLLTGKRLQFSRNAWAILTVASVFLMLDLWFWHRCIVIVGPGLATLMANFQVFFMMIFGIVLLRQIPRPMQLVAVPMALLGLSLIVGFDWNSLPPDYRMGVIYGLLTAVSYAVYLLALRKVRQRSKFRILTRELAVISIMCAAMLAVSAIAEGESLAIPSYEDFGWLVGYGVLSHCIGWLFIASSLSEVTAVDAGLALLLQPMLSFVWDIVFFDRPMTAIELLGAAIALTAIYLGSRPPSQQAQHVRQDS